VAGLSASRVPDWLRQRATLTPKRTGLVFEGAGWTFAELDALVDSACQILLDRGVMADQRIGIRASNSAGFVVAVHALMRLGAVLVPINTRLTPTEVEWQLADASVALTLSEADLACIIRGPEASVPSRVEREFDLDASHSIVYTSGTSGRPKGAILTYGNHWWSAIASSLNLGLLPDDAWLACLPLFHVGGLSILLRSVICGMTALVHARFDPIEVNRAIDEGRVSIVSVVSTMLDRMLSERADQPFPPTLRCVLLGGGPAPLPLLKRALRAGAPVVQTYGMTETASQIATLAPEEATTRVGSAGKPLMGARLRISPDGEIWVQGPTVSPGYLHGAVRKGWLRTGDLGYLDEDGYLYVLDRRDDLIISGGENVYPAEVEAVLLAHPAVLEAGVVGRADPEWGRAVAAAVVLKPGSDLAVEDLIAFCRERLASYKVPRQIVVHEALPRNAAGKLLRRELRIEPIA
jgi:O-succinylbenzoic acid--CoA ligase